MAWWSSWLARGRRLVPRFSSLTATDLSSRLTSLLNPLEALDEDDRTSPSERFWKAEKWSEYLTLLLLVPP